MIKKLIASFLLLVVSVVIIPRELIHELFDHEDTHHSHCNFKGGTKLEKKHHHCDMLHFTVSPYEGSDTIAEYHTPDPESGTFFFKEDRSDASLRTLPHLRAPPVLS